MSAARVVAGVVMLGLITFGVVAAGSGDTGGGARSSLTMIAPAAPGGGWDLVAREAQQAMRANGIVVNPRVVNIPGAAGTIGLAQFDDLPDASSTLMITGLVMVGGIEINDSPVRLTDLTPLARLADDYEVVVVPAGSPFETLDDFIEAWRAEPGLAIGGGSAGGTDHLLAGLMATEVGIDPASLNYIAFPGGGEVTTSLLAETLPVAVSSFNDFSDQITAGNIRALAVSAEEPVDGIDAPTMREAGVDVVLTNWRGMMAGPDITAEERQIQLDIVDEMVETAAWRDTLERNRWVDTYLPGDDFLDFLDEEQERVQEIIAGLGL